MVRTNGRPNMMDASAQWRMRPDDERYLTLDDLFSATDARRWRSQEANQFPLANYHVSVVEGGDLDGSLYIATLNDDKPALFTNWSFNQFNRRVRGPDIEWLRRMPGKVSADALNASLVNAPETDDGGSEGKSALTKLYYAQPTEEEPGGWVRAITSPTYGRVYDSQVVKAVMDINLDGRWVVPGKIAGQGMNDAMEAVTTQNTTLYASDRDVWVFLVDEQHPVEVDGELFFRGFITSNSEVGRARFMLRTFLFQAVCCNRCIWGVSEVKELSFRHTSQAPSRFIEEAQPRLLEFSEANTKGIEAGIHRAKAITVADDKPNAVRWLERHGFSQHDSYVMGELAEQAQDIGSSGDPTNLWNLTCGGTAYAREIAFTDERVAFEVKIGGLLDTYASE